MNKEAVTFIERCQILCRRTRFRKGVLRNLPDGMQEWHGWKEVASEFKEHLPKFHAMI